MSLRDLAEEPKALEAPAHRFIVIYIRVSEDKDRNLMVNGPWYGDTTATKEEAVQQAKELVKEARNVNTIPRVYPINPGPAGPLQAMEKAREFFDEKVHQMREAKRLTDRKKN